MLPALSVAWSPNAPDVSAGVIEEARARQWRRRIFGAAIVAAAGTAAAVLLALLGPGGSGPVAQSIETPPTVASATVLARQPYMGMSCTSPQGLVCNRIGVAIWLRTRAVTVTATFDGKSLALDSRKWSDAPVNGKHKFLAGFLQPGPFLNSGPFKALIAGMGRNGWQAPITHVHLVIDYGTGHNVQTSTSVIGFGGWG
jgi:hypothetical protein